MTDGLVFQDLPKSTGGRKKGENKYVTPGVIQALKARPGQWALLPNRIARTTVSRWRREFGPMNSLEFACRNVDEDQRADVYVRWIY